MTGTYSRDQNYVMIAGAYPVSRKNIGQGSHSLLMHFDSLPELT